MDLRSLPVSFGTRKRLCYLVEGLRNVVEVRREEDIPAARTYAEENRLPHGEADLTDLGPCLVVARKREDLRADLALRQEWNTLRRDPEDIGRDLARLSLQVPEKAINAFGHETPRHLVHDGHYTQEVLDFQPTGLDEDEVRRAMDVRIAALAKHRLL